MPVRRMGNLSEDSTLVCCCSAVRASCAARRSASVGPAAAGVLSSLATVAPPRAAASSSWSAFTLASSSLFCASRRSKRWRISRNSGPLCGAAGGAPACAEAAGAGPNGAGAAEFRAFCAAPAAATPPCAETAGVGANRAGAAGPPPTCAEGTEALCADAAGLRIRPASRTAVRLRQGRPRGLPGLGLFSFGGIKQFLQSFPDGHWREWFGEKRVGSQLRGPGGSLGVRVARDDDDGDRKVLPVRADMADQREAVHSRHPDIRHDGRNRLPAALQPADRLRARG